jgi:hypothetical protein
MADLNGLSGLRMSAAELARQIEVAIRVTKFNR